MRYAVLLPGQVFGVYQWRDLVLFVCSVQHGRKFHWLQGLCVLHLTGTRATRGPLAIPAYVAF